jgi:hypothetical protein
VSGNREAVRRNFLCGPTKVLWLFLQVLKTSQRGEMLSQFLIFQELSTEPLASAIGFPLPSSIFFKPAR